MTATPELDIKGVVKEKYAAAARQAREGAASCCGSCCGGTSANAGKSPITADLYEAAQADAIAKQTEGKLVSTFVRARKP